MVRMVNENLFLSCLLLVATVLYKSSLVTALSAIPDDLASYQKKEQQKEHHDHQRRRSLLLRGRGERENEAEQFSTTGFSWSQLEEFGERLQMYQMETSFPSSVDQDSEDLFVDAVTQPFSQPVPNGATGELIYRDHGWEFLFTFLGRGLPSGESYELIYLPNSPDQAADIVCFGNSTVGNLGQLTIFGNIEGLPSLVR